MSYIHFNSYTFTSGGLCGAYKFGVQGRASASRIHEQSMNHISMKKAGLGVTQSPPTPISKAAV